MAPSEPPPGFGLRRQSRRSTRGDSDALESRRGDFTGAPTGAKPPSEWLLERRPAPAPRVRGFERRRRPEHGEVGEAAADDLQAHREAGRREPGRDRGGRLAREVERVAERGPAEPVPSVL